ncbi:MAG: hypothetical protein L6427_00605 [Actinomycetia bacterium]|nr:hypothetical protein [Actinomycetes bacterium]
MRDERKTSPLDNSMIRGLFGVGIRRPLTLSVSLLAGLLTVLVVLMKYSTRNALFLGLPCFATVYCLLLVLWGGERKKAVGATRSRINPKRKLPIIAVGMTLFMTSILCVYILPLIYPLSVSPVIGWRLIPVLLCVAGVLLVSTPAVSFRSEAFAVDIEVNLGYMLFFLSLLAYIATVIFLAIQGGDVLSTSGIQRWLLLVLLPSGVIFVLGEAIESRSRC